jgi:membrane protein implicated in regulation of membrane protease activity
VVECINKQTESGFPPGTRFFCSVEQGVKMSFRFYTNMISQASRRIAATIFIVGLLLIGFGVIILALPQIFAFLAAAVFFIAGVGCGITAVKIFWVQRKFVNLNRDESQDYRQNVQIHSEEYYD